MCRGLGAKVTGATHIRNSRPCQDALRIETYAGKYLVAAVADGHGSDACPLSEYGSQAAVDCVHEIFAGIISEAGGEVKGVIENTMEIRLPKQLAAAWLKRVEDIYNASENPDFEFSPFLYGTTILAVMSSPEFIFALQLGDGDILCVFGVHADDEEKSRWLITPEYLPGNETHSLCMPDCWRYVKTHMLYLDDGQSAPDLIMLTTDGYSNSFLTHEGFIKAGDDILNLLRTEGADYVAENLEGWLERSSSEGSGDDIAMALMYRG